MLLPFHSEEQSNQSHAFLMLGWVKYNDKVSQEFWKVPTVVSVTELGRTTVMTYSFHSK
jgi:hypothetical protein